MIAVFLDAAMILAAGTFAHFLRFRAQNLFPQYPIVFDLTYANFLQNILIALPFLLILIAWFGLYKVRITQKYWQTFSRSAAAISIGLMAFVAIYFFNPQIFPSRLIVLMSWVLAIVLVAAGRLVILLTQRIFIKQGLGLHRLVLVSDPEKNFHLETEISKHPYLGYKIVKILDGKGDLVSQLDQIRKEEGIDEIIQAHFGLNHQTNEQLLRFTHDYNIKFNYVPDILEAQSSNISLGEIAGIPIVELKNTPLEGWGKVVKRILDFLLSLLGIIVASPLFLLVVIGIQIDSPGPILFVQDRFGQGKSFRFYKFRSMYKEMSVGDDYGGEQAEKYRQELWKTNARHGPFLKIKNDPRVTRFGRFIRRTKLDELPQLLNVLKGDMSLVGPRAHVLDEVDRYRGTYKRQFTIKPGITGLTQITQAKIPDLPFEEEIRLDTFYLENWSVALDLRLLFRTFWVLIAKKEQPQDY